VVCSGGLGNVVGGFFDPVVAVIYGQVSTDIPFLAIPGVCRGNRPRAERNGYRIRKISLCFT